MGSRDIDKPSVQKHPHVQSLEELMDYVDREARRRVERYRSLIEKKPYDQVIFRVLKESNQPMSVDLISFLTGLSKPRCCKILKSLEKWGLVRKVTISKTAYYEAKS